MTMMMMLLLIALLLLFVSGSLALPNISTTFEFSGTQAGIRVTDIQCGSLAMRDLSVSWETVVSDAHSGHHQQQQAPTDSVTTSFSANSTTSAPQQETFHLKATVQDFRLDCSFNYAYTGLGTGNNGSAIALTEPNTLDLVMDVLLQPLLVLSSEAANETTTSTTTTIVIQHCNITIQVRDIKFLNTEPLASLLEAVAVDPDGITKGLGESLCQLFHDPKELVKLFSKEGDEPADLDVWIRSFANARPDAKEVMFSQELENQSSSASTSSTTL